MVKPIGNHTFRSKALDDYITLQVSQKEISEEVAICARLFIKRCQDYFLNTLETPDASPGPDGMFCFVWDREEHHLIWEIFENQESELFYRNRDTHKLWDIDYEPHKPLPAQLIKYLKEFQTHE